MFECPFLIFAFHGLDLSPVRHKLADVFPKILLPLVKKGEVEEEEKKEEEEEEEVGEEEVMEEEEKTLLENLETIDIDEALKEFESLKEEFDGLS